MLRLGAIEIIDADPTGQGGDCFIVADQGIGRVTVCKDGFGSKFHTTPEFKEGWSVTEAVVNEKMRRRKFGTRLYEHAMREACRRGGPFRSDIDRRGHANAFWEKQEAKGRAVRKDFFFTKDKHRFTETFFEIDCDSMPSSLDQVSDPCVSKFQALRVADVLVIGPAMIAGGIQGTTLPKELRGFLVWAGLGTIVFNGANWLRFLRGSGPL